VEVDPVRPTVTPLGNKRLRVKHEESLSKFTFKFSLRRSIKASQSPARQPAAAAADASSSPSAAGTTGAREAAALADELETLKREAGEARAEVLGRGLHSSTFQLNLSRFRKNTHPEYPLTLPNTPWKIPPRTPYTT
jgi:hypothetical protein